MRISCNIYTLTLRICRASFKQLPMALPKFLSTPRAAIMIVFAAFGAYVGIFAGAIPVLMRQTGITSEQLGLALSGLTIATVLVMSFGGVIARRFTHRRVLLIALPLGCVTLTIVMTQTSAPLFFTVLIIHGGILGIIDIIMNAEGSAIEHDMKRPVFTAFHGSVSASVAVCSIASSLLTARYGTMTATAFAIVLVAFAWFLVWRNVPARIYPTMEHNSNARVASLPLVLMGVAAGLVIASETSAMFWSAKMLDDSAPKLAAISGLGAAFFGFCTAIVRFPGDALRARFGDFRLMLTSLVIAILGFLGLGFSPSFGFSVAAFALVGFGTSIVCPCIFNMATAHVPGNRAAGLSFASMVAGVPRIVAPYLFGWVSGTYSISTAFGLCAAMMVAALFFVSALRKYQVPSVANSVA